MFRPARLSTFVVAALVGLATLASASTAHADFQLRFSTNGGTSFSTPLADGAVGDGDSAPNAILIDTNPLDPDSAITMRATNQINSLFSGLVLHVHGGVDVTPNGLVVQASMDGIPTPSPTFLWSFTGEIAGHVVSMRTWFVEGSDLFGDDGSNNAFDTGSLPTANVGSGAFTVSPTYTMTAEIRITAAGASTNTAFSVDSSNILMGNTTLVPAPAGLVLALTGLPVLGLGRWLRRRGANTAMNSQPV